MANDNGDNSEKGKAERIYKYVAATRRQMERRDNIRKGVNKSIERRKAQDKTKKEDGK